MAPPKTAPRKAKDAPKTGNAHAMAVCMERLRGLGFDSLKPKEFPIGPPTLMPGVGPKNRRPPVMAMDYNALSPYFSAYTVSGFPGYPYLAELTTRPEYRAFASTLSTEITRKWITFTSTQDAQAGDGEQSDKIEKIQKAFERLKVRDVIRTCVEQDAYFGRAQIFATIKGAKDNLPLVLSPKTVPVGGLDRLSAVEAIWTTPTAWNSLDASAPDFYRPTGWYMLSRIVHASRLMTIITRPVPDILKPAFNFGGISLSQLAIPYVDNWLRTRQSISDLINNFSITVLKTAMEQILQGTDMGDDLIKRAQLFTATRSNLGLMLLDKTNEELEQLNTPLSGLSDLQGQSLEQLCVVSRIPAMILTGISPAGLNASSDGEIRVFYDWIAAQQEAYWRAPLETILKLVQLSEFGSIDETIGFNFVPLYQMTPKELSEIRRSDAESASTYIDKGVIAPEEERERLAKDKNSGYEGLDLDAVIVPPTDGSENDDEFAEDAWSEGDHPRDSDGKFASGGSSGTALFDESGFPLNYEGAKQYRDQLENETKAIKQLLDAYPKGAFNLTPDDVKASPEWQEDFGKMNRAMTRLRNFNEYFSKHYKKERDAERAARYAGK